MKNLYSSSIASLFLLLVQGPGRNLIRADDFGSDFLDEDFVNCSGDTAFLESLSPELVTTSEQFMATQQANSQENPDGSYDLNLVFDATTKETFRQTCEAAGARFDETLKKSVVCKDDAGIQVNVVVQEFAVCLSATSACSKVDSWTMMDLALMASGMECDDPKPVEVLSGPGDPATLPEKDDPVTLPEKGEPSNIPEGEPETLPENEDSTNPPEDSSAAALSTILVGSVAVLLSVSMIYLLSSS